MVKVKICGITNLEDALCAVDSGCDAVGFIFYKKSPRYITPRKAKEIIDCLPDNIVKIGVFVNQREKRIKYIAKSCGFDILQFHGNESPGFCERFRGIKIIKTFRVKNKIAPEEISRYKVFAYLFDTFAGSKFGGTGKKFNWKLIKHLEGVPQPVFLSGGLTDKNVTRAIASVKPEWVDVCSFVEVSPGKKDHQRIRKFIERAKSCKG